MSRLVLPLALALPLAMVAPPAAVRAAGQHDHHAVPGVGAEIHPELMTRLPNIVGKSLKSVVVTYAPGGYSPAHRHAGSAFVYARVLEGAIRSQVEGQPARVYKAGDYWTEQPGDHHMVSQNASDSEVAKLLVLFLVDTSDGQLTTYDP